MWRVVTALLLAASAAAQAEPKMSDERVVFQTDFGDIEFGFYPEVGAQACGLPPSCVQPLPDR
jgi:hypothetical protein